MYSTSSTTEILARALDVCALRQAVYSANIANVNVEGYRRLEVQFDEQAMRTQLASGTQIKSSIAERPEAVVTTNSVVKLDEEMAAMARNALRYQTLLGAYERSTGLLKMAIHEGREA